MNDQSGIPRPCKSGEPGNLGARCSYSHDSASSICGMYENANEEIKCAADKIENWPDETIRSSSAGQTQMSCT